jgi:CelD/BcsL family acetyltransferase involved in cellulose biosynthesis
MMRVQVISGRALDAQLVQSWEEIRCADPALQNPFFTADFTRIVASVRDDVEIAVISENGEIVAFFPFQRNESDPLRGIPVAGPISDFQGLICRPGFVCDPTLLIAKCRLVVYDFHHFITSQESFARYHGVCDPSPQMDLSQGYDAYVKEKRNEGSGLIKSCANLARRMEREVGPLRFVPHSTDPDLLQHMLALKSDQYMRTGARDNFAIDWVRRVITKVHATQTDGFAGMLSLLYAGDRIVAGHFGMRSRTVWHYWFPAYDRDMAKYSPGLNLILKMAAYAPSAGLQTIDLDRGNSLYKRRLMNAGITVTRGSVDRRYYGLAQRVLRVRTGLAQSPFGPPVRWLRRWVRGQ